MKGIDYEKYKMSPRELLTYLLLGIGADAMVSYLFYRSIIAFAIFLPGVLIFLKKKKEELAAKRRRETALQFREAIMAVSASLGAGYSVENAFIEAAKDLKNMFGKKAPIVIEFRSMAGRLGANETLETILADLAARSGSEDIKDFADVFITAKRTGGDLVSIIRKSAFHIGDKIEVKRDIETLMSAKKMEQNVMNAVPFFIILYVSINSPGFLDSLYHNPLGVAVMTGCLGAYAGAFLLAKKIVSIEV